MLDQDQVGSVIGRDVYGSDGDKIGTVGQIYADDQTGKPEWMTVRTGLFGLKETFVPLSEASASSDRVTVPYDKAFVKDAPNIDEDGHLSPDQERQLYDYYSRTDYDTTSDYDTRDYDTRDYDTREYDRDRGVGVASAGTAGGLATDRDDDALTRTRDRDAGDDDTSGRTTDDAMTVSEERLNVGTERQEAGRARLRKYVVTENVTQTVPVQREEVRVEREPITERNRDAALSGPDISEDEHEVVVHEERPVMETETVPVERVRLDTETVSDTETVEGEVRKERVDVEGDNGRTDKRT